MSEFSEFIRNASPEEKERVFKRVIDEANYDQAMTALMVAWEENKRLCSENSKLWGICHEYAKRDIEGAFDDLRKSVAELSASTLQTVKERIADPKIVDVELEDL